MSSDVYYKLLKVKEKYKGQIFGQICQNLLALSFAEKFEGKDIEVRNVEGVDIVINSRDKKYAIEAKTTSGENINFAQKDFDGLQKHKDQGYEIILAVLKSADYETSAKWIFYNAKNLRAKTNLSVNRLYTDDVFKELAQSIQKLFEKLLTNYYTKILEKGQEYLIKLLKDKGLKYSGG